MKSLGNIWGEVSKKNKKNINQNGNKKNIKQKQITLKSTTLKQNHSKHNTIMVKNNKNNKNNIFKNIFESKTGLNKANKAINNRNFGCVKDTNKKGYWGTPTWYLFHSIAAKIEPNYYSKNSTKIWDFIKLTCAHIPCPYCRNHAISYVNNISQNDINTKEKLITVLFNFHNSVNKRNYKQIYSKDDLKKYEKANVSKILNLFMKRFFKSYYNTREFQDWTKQKFKSDLLKFYKEIETHLI